MTEFHFELRGQRTERVVLLGWDAGLGRDH